MNELINRVSISRTAHPPLKTLLHGVYVKNGLTLSGMPKILIFKKYYEFVNLKVQAHLENFLEFIVSKFIFPLDT